MGSRAQPEPGLPDLHVHSEWSWDAPSGAMEATCARAVELRLPAIAFTEHGDFTARVTLRGGRLDVAGYRAALERCRKLFPSLLILSGVELGEPHRFLSETTELLNCGPFDRVLGSVHCIPVAGELIDATALPRLGQAEVSRFFRSYLDETLALVQSEVDFQVLTHLDYPKRYWPHDELAYDERHYEDAFREILRAAAVRGLALEVNTTRGMEPRRGLCPGAAVVEWWCEEGGTTAALGSDAHDPSMLTMGFGRAAALLERLGFHRPDDPTGFWTRASVAAQAD